MKTLLRTLFFWVIMVRMSPLNATVPGHVGDTRIEMPPSNCRNEPITIISDHENEPITIESDREEDPMSIDFPQAFQQISDIKTVLDQRVEQLSIAGEWFLLSVKDDTSLGPLCLTSGVLYKDGTIFLLEEFYNFPDVEYRNAYCSILAHIFLLFIQCGYPIAILEQEDISKNLSSFMDETVTLNVNTHREEMLMIANKILSEGGEVIDTLELEELEPIEIQQLRLTDGLFEKISFENCTLSDDVIENLLQYKKLKILRLSRCKFSPNVLIEWLKGQIRLQSFDRSPIEEIDIEGSSLGLKLKAQLKFLASLCGINILDEESDSDDDSDDDGCKKLCASPPYSSTGDSSKY